ncbi:MAG: hypothetical protein ACK501_07190 [Planctomycetota bacterium]|jgi:hypothetical protein
MPSFHHDFTFNPDGSGRVTVRWAGPGGPGAPSPDDFVRSELERAQGVVAWAGVDCVNASTADGEQLVFTATAWFEDARALRFHCQGFHVNLLDFAVERQDDGAVTIRSLPPPAGDGPVAVAADASPQELQRAIAAEREKIGMAREFLAGMFGDLVATAVLRAPGPLVGPAPGTRLDERTVEVQFAGRKLIAIVDRLLTDDAAMAKLLRQGAATPQAALELLGDQGPLHLQTGPGAVDQFDFADEVAAAQAAMPTWTEAVGAAVPEQLPSEPLANVRVVACKLVLEADADRDLCPQGQNVRGVQLTIAGDLAEPCLDLEEASCTAALADDGTDLLPPDEWDRRCHFPKQTNDGRTVYLDLGLPLPDGARGFAHLAGQIVCLASRGSETVDLGFAELVPDAEGAAFGAKLLRVEADGDECQLELELQVASRRVLDAAIHAGDDVLPLEPRGYSSSGDQCSLSYRLGAPLPADARFVVTLATELVRTQYAFELHAIDWFGRPL